MVDWKFYTVEITSASASDLLTMINLHGFILYNVRFLDELRIQADIKGTDRIKLYKLIDKRGDSLKIIGSRGVFFAIQKILKRPVLLIGCLLWLFLIIYLPTRVLFIYVDGNRVIDSVRIIEAAERSGICFGASRRYVRSEKVKNKLLSEIDALQWAGVNTYGCVAVISVKERAMPQYDSQNHVFCSIVAERDGVISNITVTSGNTLCKVGQAVRKGQILVSGFTDCDLTVRAGQAEAEVMAFTEHRVNAVTLATGIKRASLKERKVQYSIQIGKNIVKLFNNSRIPDAECVKIYTQKCLTLPGGFELPVFLIKEESCSFEEKYYSTSSTDKFIWMKESVTSYILQDMVSGKILRSNVRQELLDGICSLNAVYTCNEMIGRVRMEKIGEYNG